LLPRLRIVKQGSILKNFTVYSVFGVLLACFLCCLEMGPDFVNFIADACNEMMMMIIIIIFIIIIAVSKNS
jgi:hypothetical protein